MRQAHALPLLLEAAELSRSTFYYQVNALAHPDEGEEELRGRIRAIYDENQGRYGYRRITLELANQGEAINHKRVQRLMAELGLQSRVRIKRYRAFKGAANVVVSNVWAASLRPRRPTRSG